jgi:NAD(P)-dependent dehydrogenase (short-subunit alcohol dehydrogenase family)
MASRVWLVTGCSSGFGAAIARAALAAGDTVVATARRAEDSTSSGPPAPSRRRWT